MAAMIAFVQAFVWITILGFCYVIWKNQQATSPLAAFEHVRDLRRVLQHLNTLWVIVGMSLILFTLLTVLPPLLHSADNVTTQCMTVSPQLWAEVESANPTAMLCPPPEPAPPDLHGDALGKNKRAMRLLSTSPAYLPA